MGNRRKFQDLTIRDNFMFAAVMMHKDICKKFLEMLLGIKIREVAISYEKCLIYNPECKGVRLDVYASDEKNTRYDIEMQVAEQELGKRTRYYHSQMDMDILESGREYKDLPSAYVKELQQSIHSVKENRKLENSFMSLEEIREAGRAEGRLEGRLEGKREAILEFLEELGEILLSLKERIMSETDAATLKSMLKAASSAVSYADFEEKMKSL